MNCLVRYPYTHCTNSNLTDLMATRILVASIGNPAPYAQSFHSAGHVVAEALQSHLGYPEFTKSTSPNGRISQGADYTLYQSPSQMNVSGKPVAAAWRHFLGTLDANEKATAKLVVLHDELELPPGTVKMKVGGSAKGHNGLKDIIKSLGGAEFVRIGIGIGRPESRDSRSVASYVLSKMSAGDMTKMKTAVFDVARKLEQIKDS